MASPNGVRGLIGGGGPSAGRGPGAGERLRHSVRRWIPDIWPALIFLIFGLAATAPAAASQPSANRPIDAGGFVLVALAALALLPLRRRPGAALLFNGLVVTGYLAAGYAYGPILLTLPAAMFGVAVSWPVRRAAVVVAADALAVLSAAIMKRFRDGMGDDLVAVSVHVLAWTAVVAAVFAIGAAVRVRRVAAAGVREEQARRAASEERLRMAQDLHDSVGHGLAVIAMQAGVALHVLDRDPAKAREAMEAVRATSREALDGLRVRLEELRSPGAAERRPAPGLADLGRLAERVSAGGVALRIERDPDLPPLSPAVDAAAYRILQESLTNVLRHAGATAVRIRVSAENGTLRLRVTDDGPAAAAPAVAAVAAVAEPSPVPAADTDGHGQGGSGIDGMRAQAEALNGGLRAGPRPAGGFEVLAWLPLPQRPVPDPPGHDGKAEGR